jgi:uncharacterized protein
MALVIDGHNLIGILPDIRLGEPGDELRLLERLRLYRARAGAPALIVFFDSGDLPAPAHNSPDLSSPGLQVRFSSPGQSADDAILRFLEGRAQPGQYAVVTNDHGLAQRARLAGASTLPASTFAARLARPQRRPPQPPPGPNPHDPEYADIYDAFVQAEKRQGKRAGAGAEDPGPWVEKLYGDDVEAAQRAATWLGLHGGPQALGALRDALTHSDVRVRAAAVLALGDLGDRAAVPDLVERLRHDRASMAREAAAESLGRIGDRSVEGALQQAMGSDAKRKVRKAAEEALIRVRARHP